ncbi:MAG: 16S rRNA (adenine(1518)-N(6)/adenine(1519)-N(6))-dimethyltransferase RsmA [Succinivibrionaceae bacterium]
MNDKITLGHTARKRFGQNFLQDKNVIANIVKAINPQKNDNIVEIGPGLAAITTPISELVDKLHVIELDRDLADRLRNNPFLSPKLEIHETDALRYNFSEIATPSNKIRVFGNLPYNISTPLMMHLFDNIELIKDMHFMLQKEVVERLAAAPNSKDYGRLGIITQYYCKVIPIMEVKPHAFRPAPKVTSAVVRLIPHEQKPYQANSIKNLERVLAMAFNQRRKTVHNSLGDLFTDEMLAQANIEPNQRAENITLQQFVMLANMIEG